MSILVFSGYSASRTCAGGCSGADVLGVVGLAAERVRATILAWAGRCRRRHAALAIDAHTLDDIGLSRGLITLEAAKPFWRA